jgi:hypothetical protein
MPKGKCEEADKRTAKEYETLVSFVLASHRSSMDVAAAWRGNAHPRRRLQLAGPLLLN